VLDKSADKHVELIGVPNARGRLRRTKPKGDKSADLPVQAPTKYELMANLKTEDAVDGRGSHPRPRHVQLGDRPQAPRLRRGGSQDRGRCAERLYGRARDGRQRKTGRPATQPVASSGPYPNWCNFNIYPYQFALHDSQPVILLCRLVLPRGEAMSDRSDELRQTAAECLARARATTDAAARASLLIMAQKLYDLANGPAIDFDAIVREFNDRQMSDAPASQPVMQQQQQVQPRKDEDPA
jgi:hypothetical protein